MSRQPDVNTVQPAWLSSSPPRRVLGSLMAYVSAVSVGVAAVAVLATAEVPVEAWIAPF
ncbi:hypothetical protein [Polaromonas sp. YR568]|uniref:hypothetical protein n=1 Tax=Polaromonas sp. YR568 TaxID=1855301 RepID=UPI0031380CD3